MKLVKEFAKSIIINLMRSKYFVDIMQKFSTYPVLKKFGVDKEFVRTWNILGIDLYLSVDIQSYIERQIIYKKNYIENINFHLIKNLKENSVYLDIGANIGTTTLPIALLHPSIEVHSFEPNPRINKKLRRNIKMNAATNIRVFDYGVSNKASQAELFFTKSEKGNHGTSALRQNSDIVFPDKIDIQLHSVDEHSVECNLPVSLIKIDVQGFELEVLLGAQNTIKKYKPIIIFEHEDRYHTDPEETKTKLADLFDSLEYEIYEIDKYDYRNLRHVVWTENINENLIAFPR